MRLKDIREDNDKKQSEIATILQTDQSYYSKYELGKHPLPIEHLRTLCLYYNVSADYLLGLTDEDPIYSQRRQKNNLNQENLATLKRFEAFLYNEQERQDSHLK